MDKENLQFHFKADFKNKLFYLVIVLTLAVMISGESRVSLTPSVGNVIKGDNLTLTCSASGGQWLPTSMWSVNSQIEDGFITYDQQTFECSGLGLFVNESQYACKCDGLNKYRAVIIDVGTTRHGEQWNCRQYSLSVVESKSNVVTISVEVPVTNASINDSTYAPIEVNEYHNVTLQCVTSPCRPAANITWYFIDKDGAIRDAIFSQSMNIVENNTLPRTWHWIRFNASRGMNGWSVKCSARNINKYPEVKDTVKLNVKFPTNNPTIQCAENETYRVIRNRLSNVTCTVDGGNPAGRLEWSCDHNYIHSHFPQNNLSRTIVLNATKVATCTCTSSNSAGNRKLSVTIDVQYPPELKEFKTTLIREGESLFLKCNAVRSKPPVETIEWTSTKHRVPNATLIIRNVSRTDDTVYTCTANNTMKPSCQHLVIGSTSKTIQLEVLYPPLVNISSAKQFTMNESEPFMYSCPIIEGNPSSTKVIWRRSSDNRIWNSRELSLPHVSRYDDAVYTCTASNAMTDSNGTTRHGNSSGYIIVIVQFRTNVTDFFIQGHAHHEYVVVMEHTHVTFECRANSTPTANIRILKRNTDVKSSSGANSLSYNETAYCTGEENVTYSCHGKNVLNTEPSRRSVFLSVKCKPRADMNESVQLIVASAINKTVTMSYTAVAYPPPLFRWYRNGSTIDTSDPRISVSSSNLQTQLTIINVKESDFGEYELNITNTVGSIKESFLVKPEGVPEVPTHLTQDNTSTTDTTIALYWTSGFNNGLEQTFTILYRKQSGYIWQNASIPDSGQTGTTIRYSIKTLAHYTSYVIVLFAVNDFGRSTSNATLTCSTKQASVLPSQGPSAAIIGGIVGSVTGIVLIACILVGFVIFRRRAHNKARDNQLSTGTTHTSVLYENVTNGKRQEQSPLVDSGIYENSELCKPKTHISNGETSIQHGKHADLSKKSCTDKQATTHEKIQMKATLKDKKASTRRSTHLDAPPPISAKSDFAGLLSKVDDDDDGNVYTNTTDTIERIENIYVHELFDLVTGKSFESFATEFNVLPKGLTMPYTVAVKPENIKLNRYNGIFPYDHSRVTIPDDPDFFTNACYMDGYRKEKCYIASLGPTAETSSNFKTFWRMVWHEQSDIIVMVTNLREITGMKCEQYWPKLETSTVYGDITVTIINVEEYAEYTVRTFNVSHDGNCRAVTQLHFTAWPDKGVPDDLTSLLEFRQRLISTPSIKLGPVIVHCSAGIGRTGTLIALDRLILEGKATHSINVSTCVRSMRQQRVSMVQTQEQYMYIYKACVYALAFECDSVLAEKFHDKFKSTTDAQFADLFKKLKIIVDNESEKEKKAILNNKLDNSNRTNADIAGDRHRVRIYVDKESEDSDYTNAVYINSFKIKNKFIAAQTPLKDCVQDFVCAVFQEQCICVVDMDGNTPSKMDVGVYLPVGKQSLTFGNFTICSDQLESNPNYTVNKMKIENTGKFYKGEWTCYHFKYHDWKHGKETPGNTNDFVELWKEINEYANQFGEKEDHILIHCLDGSNRSGLFCFVACLLEKIQCERQVNVGNTLRQLRTRRKTTVRNANQLKFCFKAVDAFIETNKAK